MDRGGLKTEQHSKFSKTDLWSQSSGRGDSPGQNMTKTEGNLQLSLKSLCSLYVIKNSIDFHHLLVLYWFGLVGGWMTCRFKCNIVFSFSHQRSSILILYINES